MCTSIWAVAVDHKFCLLVFITSRFTKPFESERGFPEIAAERLVRSLRLGLPSRGSRRSVDRCASWLRRVQWDVRIIINTTSTVRPYLR